MNNKHLKSGFTLVEIIISLMIFSIVAVVAIGALVKIISANKKAQTLQSAITNLNFALESMSREMRVGSSYYCVNGTGSVPSDLPANDGDACLNGVNGQTGATIAFLSSKRDSTSACNFIYAYRFKPDPSNSGQFILEKTQQTACNGQILDSDFFPVVGNNVVIDGYYLKVSNAGYPLALVRVSGYAGVKEKEKTYFDVQTAVSARVTD